MIKGTDLISRSLSRANKVFLNPNSIPIDGISGICHNQNIKQSLSLIQQSQSQQICKKYHNYKGHNYNGLLLNNNHCQQQTLRNRNFSNSNEKGSKISSLLDNNKHEISNQNDNIKFDNQLNTISESSHYYNYHDGRSNMNIWTGILGLSLAVFGVLGYNNHTKIPIVNESIEVATQTNEDSSSKKKSENDDKIKINVDNKLVENEDQSTLEDGLLVASRNELEEDSKKKDQLENKKGIKSFPLKTLIFVNEYFIEPLITCGRFIQLSLIFIPVLLSYPIVWLGSIQRDKSHERSGSLLWYKYLTFSMELAGASFIKLGQWAASRTDIFPREFCNQLSKLHSNGKPHSLHQTKKIIRKSFGGLEFNEIFEEFNEIPIGVGAIAQVYSAKLNSALVPQVDSETNNHPKHGHKKLSLSYSRKKKTKKPTSWVAIKVLHPHVEKTVNRDLKIMYYFAKIIDYIPTMEWLSLPDEVEQFGKMMRLQLDLRIEGKNLEVFRSNFDNREDIKFPMPYLDYTSRNVLVEEKIHAIPVSTFLKLCSKGNLKGQGFAKEISDKGLDSFLQMLLLDNFIHADLHPGNIFIRLYRQDRHILHNLLNDTEDDVTREEINRVTDDLLNIQDNNKLEKELKRLYDENYHAQICYIDTGLVTELNAVDRVNFIDLFRALSEFNGYRAGELMVERSKTPYTVIDEELFALKVDKLVTKIKNRTFALGNVSIGDLLDQVLGLVRKHHVRMEGDFITVIVAILLLEGIGRQLNPDLDLFYSALPILRQLGVQDGNKILKNMNTASMIKVWLGLEIRQFIHASIEDIHNLVKYDGICPNY